MVGLRHQTAFHFDRDEQGREIDAEQREALIRPYLPDLRNDGKTTSSSPKRRPVRHLIKSTLHLLLYNLVQFIFSVYIRFRIAYRNIKTQITSLLYYHHRTPEYIQRDLQGLNKLPNHLSIILELDNNETTPAALEALANHVCELAAWSACAGIPMLSIYETTGTYITLASPLYHKPQLTSITRHPQILNPTLTQAHLPYPRILLRRLQPLQTFRLSQSAPHASLFTTLIAALGLTIIRLASSFVHTAAIRFRRQTHSRRPYKDTDRDVAKVKAIA